MKVRQELQPMGLVCEEWGGTTIFVDISALKKEGIDKLLSMILLQAEVMELKANPTRLAKATSLSLAWNQADLRRLFWSEKAPLKLGDIVLCGPYWGKARALINEEGARLKEAGPSVAVRLLGLNGIPEAGLEFYVATDEKNARDIAEGRAEATRAANIEDRSKAMTMQDVLVTTSKDGAKTLRVLVKADTQGSVEAIVEALKKIESSKVSLEIMHSAVGIITESDVDLAAASKAAIVGFHTRIDSGAVDASKRLGVQIKLYSIIYELVDEVKNAMSGLLEPSHQGNAPRQRRCETIVLHLQRWECCRLRHQQTDELSRAAAGLFASGTRFLKAQYIPSAVFRTMCPRCGPAWNVAFVSMGSPISRPEISSSVIKLIKIAQKL